MAIIHTNDIRSLLNFRAPQYRCWNCWALFTCNDVLDKHWQCPVCEHGHHGGTRDDAKYCLMIRPELNDPMGQGRRLARIAWAFMRYDHIHPVATLYEAISQASSFVHVVTWGIDRYMVGALKMASCRVPVRAILSNIHSEQMQDDLTRHTNEAPQLDIRLTPRDWDAPHQKLVVIDGVLAFNGSANLTTEGWRKVPRNRDNVEVVTDVDEVMKLHNRLFSPIWHTLESNLDPQAWFNVNRCC